MVSNKALLEKEERLNEIRKYIAKFCQEGVDAKKLKESDIGKKYKLDWQAARRDLAEIEKESLIVRRQFGNKVIYFPSSADIESLQEHCIDITSSQKLYLDNFPGRYGNPFMRLALKVDGTLVGSVIIPVNKVDEFLEKFKNQVKKLKELKQMKGGEI